MYVCMYVCMYIEVSIGTDYNGPILDSLEVVINS